MGHSGDGRDLTSNLCKYDLSNYILFYLIRVGQACDE